MSLARKWMELEIPLLSKLIITCAERQIECVFQCMWSSDLKT